MIGPWEDRARTLYGARTERDIESGYICLDDDYEWTPDGPVYPVGLGRTREEAARSYCEEVAE